MADLYEACAAHGLPNPRDVDELELWEVATLVGGAREESKADRRDPAAGRDLVAERVAAAREGRLPPTAGPPPAPRARSLPSGRHMTEGRTRGRY